MNRANAGIVVAVSTLIGSTAWAIVPEKYQSIVDRNAFGLSAPVIVTNSTPPPPPVDLKLTGFAVMGGMPRAYFTIPAKDPKSVQQYLNLAEGEREGTLEVVSISQQEGEVRVRNNGADTLLSLKDNGFQPAKGAAVNPISPGPVASSLPNAASAIYTPAAQAPAVVQPIIQTPQQLALNSGSDNQRVAMRTMNTQPHISGTPVGSLPYNPVIAGSPPPPAANSPAQIDPAKQLEDMRRHRDIANQYGGLPLQVTLPPPNTPPSIVNTQPPRPQMRIVPMPPLPL